jgi:DNA replication protein DnaC
MSDARHVPGYSDTPEKPKWLDAIESIQANHAQRAHDAGFPSVEAYEAHLVQQERLDERERKRALLEARMEASRDRWIDICRDFVPDDMGPRIVDGTVDMNDAMAATIEWWRKREKPILVLVGSTGLGKTVAMLRCNFVRSGQVVAAPWLARRLDPWHTDAHQPAPSELLDLRTPVMGLDELGTEIRNSRFESALDTFIGMRLSMSRRTVITANFDTAAGLEVYGERFISRMHQNAKIIRITGDDQRVSS